MFIHCHKSSRVSPSGHGLWHGISWVLTSVGLSTFVCFRVITAWFGSFLQSGASQVDQSDHLVYVPVIAIYDGRGCLIAQLPSHLSSPQVSLPGLKVSSEERLAQDLSGWRGVQDRCSSSRPPPHVSVQNSVFLQGPKTKGSEEDTANLWALKSPHLCTGCHKFLEVFHIVLLPLWEWPPQVTWTWSPLWDLRRSRNSLTSRTIGTPLQQSHVHLQNLQTPQYTPII